MLDEKTSALPKDSIRPRLRNWGDMMGMFGLHRKHRGRGSYSDILLHHLVSSQDLHCSTLKAGEVFTYPRKCFQTCTGPNSAPKNARPYECSNSCSSSSSIHRNLLTASDMSRTGLERTLNADNNLRETVTLKLGKDQITALHLGAEDITSIRPAKKTDR